MKPLGLAWNVSRLFRECVPLPARVVLVQRLQVRHELLAVDERPDDVLQGLRAVLLFRERFAGELELDFVSILPLIADETGIVAVDARIVVAYPKPSTDPYDHLAIHPYPAHLAHHMQLNDGTDVLIRPIRPEDAESEARFVRELSDESKYFRFMNTFQELSQEMLIRLTQIDYHNEMALVAMRLVDGVEKEQIGVARYAINVDKKSCEFALTVADDWQGRGVGQQLMKDLMAVARTRDLETIEGQVLANNKRMLRLMGTLGFEISIDPSDSSVKRTVARLHQASS